MVWLKGKNDQGIYAINFYLKKIRPCLWFGFIVYSEKLGLGGGRVSSTKLNLFLTLSAHIMVLYRLGKFFPIKKP